MNWVDLIVLAVVALSGLAGVVRGLVREVLGLGSWIAAGVCAALAFTSWAQPLARRTIGNADIADPVAFGSVFLVVLIALNLFARFVSGAVRTSALGGLDRSLGLVFGLGRGAAVAIAAYILGGLAMPPDTWPPVVLEARTLPATYRGAVWVADLLPADIRPQVAPPPAGRQATAEALLRAAPQGRAVGSDPAPAPPPVVALPAPTAPVPAVPDVPSPPPRQTYMPGTSGVLHGAVPGTTGSRSPPAYGVGPAR